MMKTNLSVKMLAGLALVLLVSSITEGRIVGKCELKARLEAALRGNGAGATVAPPNTNPVPGNATAAPGNATNGPVNATAAPGNATNGPVNATAAPGNATSRPGNATAAPVTPANLALIAKIVCTVERVSKFNTALVTTFKNPAGRPGDKPRPGKPSKPGRGRRSPGKGSDSSESSESNEGPFGNSVNFYGIFQLNDRVACDSGSGQSLNLCRINCNALLNDDITDDIACLKTLLNYANIASAMAFPPQKSRKHFVDECLNVNPLRYFSVCV
ncbi:hypothetical protein DNTS_031448 [Danionella cerebrum]|uniref:Glycosyl hydrolases family 22 (GH22) domain-containing protein n=1 Tax=Danionella cerebrum TaxID=2873325 RepID=A0A553QQ74_9TELE|nr:hypothetical protein DNTS_031448 [Danionella translucida]